MPSAMSRARRSATPAPSAATPRRMRAASITAMAFPATGRGGITAFPTPPEGTNRGLAFLSRDAAVAVSPSDGAPALVALDAKFVLQSSSGQRVIGTDEFFIGPKVDITHLTSTKPEEILTAIRIPKSWANASFYFEKVADRNTWDFPLVNVAAAIKVQNGTVQDSRIACGGVSAVPRRLTQVEQILKGQPINEQTAKIAGQSASRGARPLNYNGFKIPLMENLVMRAVRDAKA